MDLKDLPFWSADLLELECDTQIDWRVSQSVDLVASLDGYLLGQAGQSCAVTPTHRQDFFAFLQERPATQWLLSRAHGLRVWVQWLECVEVVPLDLNIGVTEPTAEALFAKTVIPKATVESAIEWLESHFLVASQGTSGSAVLIGRGETSKLHFQLFGAEFRLDVRGGGADVVVTRLAPLPRNRPNLILANGDIRFVPQDLKALLNTPAQQAAYEAALRDTGNYLKLWDEYSNLQIKKATEQAREVGWFQIERAELLPGDSPCWRLIPRHADEYRSFRKAWQEQGLSSSAMVELTEFPPDLDDTEASTGPDATQLRGAVRGRVEFNSKDAILIPRTERSLVKPAANGYVALSLAGDVTVQRRREEAKERIAAGSGLPQLKYLIEGVPFSPPVRPRVSALSRTAREAFKAQPNPRQIEALDVALNTPDIALIVGPPGTGKTQVIAALQRRLAELIGAERVQHQLLITSYQHDAVDNALSRVEVYGLPSIKVGNRGRTGSGAADPVVAWADRVRERVQENLGELFAREPLAAAVAKLRPQLVSLRLGRFGPGERWLELDRLDKLLLEIEDFGLPIPPDLRFRWEGYLTAQTAASTTGDAAVGAKLLREARALRTTRSAMDDDGADRADDLLRTLRRAGIRLKDEQAVLLDKAADGVRLDDSLLEDLEVLKATILDSLVPDYRPPDIKQLIDADGLAILTELESAVEAPLATSRRGVASVVADYFNELQGDSRAISDAVSQYAIVVGATCQQAAGQAMSRLQSLTDTAGTAAIQFDTVVVDEAARANPLDLFVPISMARRRIILVGDHRQLPHLLEPDLERELAERQGLTDAQRKAYEVSLFQRLMSSLQGAGGPQRIVLLNEQYRMHPVLGDFVSREFYEKEGLEPIRSARTADDFPLDVPGFEGKVCAWIDVDSDSGPERKVASSQSRIRDVEASRLVERVSRILKARPDLSVGVITFYAAQRDRLRTLCVAQGILAGDEVSESASAESRTSASPMPMLEVGTVDAFQGKEFDIVFLSIVRSSIDKGAVPNEGAEDREKRLNRRYGHLRLSNRMNVAMSRQRRLLVVVGDKAMAEGEAASLGAPALASFLNLCMEKFGAIL
jgi:hypothetical protein